MAGKKPVFQSISVLAGEFGSMQELQNYCDDQYRLIQKLTDENVDLRSKVTHLEQLLSQTTQLVPEPSVIAVDVSNEQAICEIQIKKIQEKAHLRELTLEETKRLEILIKSLYLIKEKTGGGDINADFKKLSEGLSVEKLTELASMPEPVEPDELN